ncbi:MAG: hypothetical protein HC888_13385 [Candidatus Competibacteraceae bacterium]|nr:hypothetical protein [Candidatus Competibacteraceae bacterium]
MLSASRGRELASSKILDFMDGSLVSAESILKISVFDGSAFGFGDIIGGAVLRFAFTLLGIVIAFAA